MGLKE